MANRPTISAIIPVHNGEEYVAEAIRSVLSQTVAPDEVWVVDDGSTDSTAEVIRELGGDVHYVFQENAGVSVARNHGAALASTDLVAFLDHDDTWVPSKLERQAQELAERPAMLVLCGMAVTDATGRQISEMRLCPRTDLLTGMLMFDGTETVSCSSTGLIRKRDFESIGGFDPHLSTSADWDFVVRVLVHGKLGYVDESLVRYRLHGSNMSRNIDAMERDMVRAFGKAFSDPMLPGTLQQRRSEAYACLYRMLAGSHHQSGNWRKAVSMAASSLRYDPRPILRTVQRRMFANRLDTPAEQDARQSGSKTA